MGKQPKRLTEAEAEDREARLEAAGIKVVAPRPGTGTITLLKRREPEETDSEK